MSIDQCEPEKWRERVRQDVLAAWAEYQVTGLHVTVEEADAWFAQLEDREDREPPPTHH